MPRFPGAGYLNSSNSPTIPSRSSLKKWEKSMMKSYPFPFANPTTLPLRIRPFFLLMGCLVLLVLAFFGFTDFTRGLPINHKVLHFMCLGIATSILYWVVDVEEDARRIWIWRNASLILTGFVCVIFGSIGSEILRSFLPYKEFQIANIIANLMGAAVGLAASYHLDQYSRHRREISRLYRPVNSSLEESDDDEEEGLLPTHQHNKPNGGQIRLGNVWDETDEGGPFTIGDDDERSARLTPNPTSGSPWISSGKPSTSPMGPSLGPKIVITAPSTASLHDQSR